MLLEPGLEPGGDQVTVGVEPLIVPGHGHSGIGRREVRAHGSIHLARGQGIGGRIGNELGELGVVLGRCDVGDEVHGRGGVVHTSGDHQIVCLDEGAVPLDGQRGALLLEAVDPPVVADPHDHGAVGEELGTGLPVLPPDDVVRNGLELGERTIDVEGVERGRIDPVGEQRGLEDTAARSRATHGALAGESLEVEEIRPPLGYRAVPGVGAVRQDQTPEHDGHAVPGRPETLGLQLVAWHLAAVDGLEQSVSALQAEVVLHIDHIPADVSALHHGLQGLIVGGLILQQRDGRVRLNVGDEPGLRHRGLVIAAPTHDRERVGHRSPGRGTAATCGRGQGEACHREPESVPDRAT